MKATISSFSSIKLSVGRKSLVQVKVRYNPEKRTSFEALIRDSVHGDTCEHTEEEANDGKLCKICARIPAVAANFPLIWESVNKEGTCIITAINEDNPPAWYHVTNNVFPYKQKYTFCTAQNQGTVGPTGKDPFPDFKPKSSIDIWLDNFADRFEKHGDRLLDTDMEPFRGFLAGVGSKQRVEERRKPMMPMTGTWVAVTDSSSNR